LKEKTSVAILSGNRLLRESIARILTHKREFTVVATEIPVCSQAQREGGLRPDVWISDSLKWLMEDWSGYFAEGENPGCILVAMPDDPRTFLAAVRRGVLGYVLQEAAAVDVIAAVRSVARGEAVCPARLMRVLFECISSQNVAPGRASAPFGLTRREQQLVPLVGRGLTNKEIAAELSLSEQTIKSHIHRILRKMGVDDRSAILDVFKDRRLEAWAGSM
jgi:DNA-binding NarL/FixJ family response regulator